MCRLCEKHNILNGMLFPSPTSFLNVVLFGNGIEKIKNELGQFGAYNITYQDFSDMDYVEEFGPPSNDISVVNKHGSCKLGAFLSCIKPGEDVCSLFMLQSTHALLSDDIKRVINSYTIQRTGAQILKNACQELIDEKSIRLYPYNNEEVPVSRERDSRIHAVYDKFGRQSNRFVMDGALLPCSPQELERLPQGT